MSIALATLGLFSSLEAENGTSWKKHVVMSLGHCNTAVALDANGDANLDVIASFNSKVSLFVTPDWYEIILYRFSGKSAGCIHSAVIDVDGDGDLDWAGTLADDHPFDLRTVDMDGDGDFDLLNAGRGTQNVCWYENPLK